MPDFLQYDFMVRALIGSVLVGALAPTFGVFMVLRRLSLIADTLSHVALTGVAVGVLTGAYPPIVAVGATSAAAASIEELRARRIMPGDAALAVFLYGALASAVIIFSIAGGFNSSLFGYLFGSVLTVSTADLWLIGGLAVIAGAFSLFFYFDLAQTTFDTDLARTNGVRVHAVNISLAVLTGATVTVSMRVVGVLLVGALIVVPALIALRISRGLSNTIVIAIGIGVAVSIAGTIIAYYADIAPGGTVVLTAVAVLAVVEAFHFAFLRRQTRPTSPHAHRPRSPTAAASAQLPLPISGMSTEASGPTAHVPARTNTPAP